MKIENREIKGKLFLENFQKFHVWLQTYRTGNFELLSSICTGICIFEEYLTTPQRDRLYQAINENIFLDYLDGVYGKHIVLVLKYSDKCFSYTRKYIIKMIRGEGKHGQSEVRDLKREALHKFLFEDVKLSEYVFAITYNWVIYPGIWKEGGNRDSSNFFSEYVEINEEPKHPLTTIESVIFNIAVEIWSSFELGKVIWPKQIVMSSDLDSFVDLIGLDTINNIKAQQVFWKEFKANAQVLKKNVR